MKSDKKHIGSDTPKIHCFAKSVALILWIACEKSILSYNLISLSPVNLSSDCIILYQVTDKVSMQIAFDVLVVVKKQCALFHEVVL